MMQMFKYPQGEGGRSGRMECQPATAHRSVLPFYLCLTPLLSRFVTRTLGPQTVNSKGEWAMAINLPAHNAAQAGRPRLRKSLKLWQVVMMGLAYLTPMTVFDTFGIVSGISNGHVPASYLLALAGVLFTAISYGKLVRQFPEAGSAYTYAQKSISPHVGFMVGWSSLLDYLFLPMINVLLAKIYLSALFPEVPPWVWVVTFVAILTAANLKSVNLVANFNTLFVLVQISIMVVFVILVVQGLHKGEGVGTVWSLQPFISQNAHLIPIITGATIVCFSFLGFDAVTTLSEETPDAARVIPKAIFLYRDVRRHYFHRRVVLYAAVLPGYSSL